VLFLQRKRSQYSWLSKRRSIKASLSKPEGPVSIENSRTSGQCNKDSKVTLDKYMSKNESTKRQSKDNASRIKHQTCYTFCDKGHLSKDCPKTQSLIHKVVNNISHVEPKNDTSTIKMISSPCGSPRTIWVPKQKTCWLTMKDPTRLGYQNLLNQVVGGLRCIGSLSINKKVESLCKYWSNAISRTRYVLILVLEFNLYLFFLFSCKVRNHIASHSKFISLCHMMLLMDLLWSNVFYLNRYTSYLQMRKERKWSITHREIQVIHAYQWMSTNS
jgi:hypothetical protein